jgi:ABC-type nitrate/sulfonate/bicarbonate transport system substrate-binding protein
MNVVNSAGAVALAALAGNGVDIGVANPVSIAQAYAKGVPISVFAGGGLYTAASPATLLVVPKNSPLQKAKELEGKTIGLPGLGDQLQAATI